MKSNAPPVEVRAANLGDRAYVIETWLQSYRDSVFASRLPHDVYWSRFGHVGLVEDTLERVPVTVLCMPDEPAFIYGWACAGGGRLEYVFVRHDFRRLGFGTELLRSLDIGRRARVSHVTRDGGHLLKAAGCDPEFVNPYKERGRR